MVWFESERLYKLDIAGAQNLLVSKKQETWMYERLWCFGSRVIHCVDNITPRASFLSFHLTSRLPLLYGHRLLNFGR